MSNLTPEEIEKLILNNVEVEEPYEPEDWELDEEFTRGSWDDVEEFLYWSDWVGNTDPQPVLELPDVGTVRKVADFGGEGKGDERWMVVSVTFLDGTVKLYRKEGYYASYDGTTWDEDFTLREVTAQEKVVIFYD